MSSNWRFKPSSLNCTPDTPMLSDAVAEMGMVPNCVEALAGVVMETVGGVMSGVPVGMEAMSSRVGVRVRSNVGAYADWE